MATLLEKREYLSEKIKIWLVSDTLSLTIAEINQKLKLPLKKGRFVSLMVLRVVAGDLKPENLIAEIMTQLEYDFAKAKELALEIEEKLLKPMRSVLKTELDIDIDLIKEGKEKPIEKKPPVVSEMPTPEIPIVKEVPMPGIPIFKKEEVAPAPLPISEMKLPEAEKPFVIHAEKEEIKPIPEAPRRTFAFKAEIPTPPPPPKPVTAKIERGNQ